MMETIVDWVLQIKNNPELHKKMIHTMKSHPQMEIHLKSHLTWMDSIY